MKNSLLFVSVLFCLNVSAQIKITNADMPKSGDNIIYSTAIANIDVSKTGEDYTWDFSGLQPVTNDTFKFANPTGIYLVNFFGNVARKSRIGNQEGVFFFKNSNTEWAQTGLGFKMPALNTDAPLKFNNPDQVYKFPLTFGSNTYSDTFGGVTTIQTFKIAFHGKRTTQVDGWGTIKTPFGTFDCIRLKAVVIEKDTVGFAPFDNSRTEYTWLAKGHKIPVLQITIPTNIQQQTTIIYRDSARDITNIPREPRPVFMASDTAVFEGDTVAFVNRTIGFNNTYNWEISPSTYTFAPGFSAASQNLRVIFSNEGKYTISLSVSNINGNGKITKQDYIMVSKKTQTGIQNESIFSQMNIWPNPANGKFNIQLPESKNGKFTIEIFDLAGKPLNINAIYQDKIISIDLSDKPKGIYLLKISNGTETVNRKLILQ